MRRSVSQGDVCALDVDDSDLEEHGVVVVVERRGTLSKDIDMSDEDDDTYTAVATPPPRPSSYSMATIMAHLNTLGAMLALQLFTLVLVATMTNALHALAGVAAAINFMISLYIFLLRVVARPSGWRSTSLPMIVMGFYVTFPAFVLSMIMYVASSPATATITSSTPPSSTSSSSSVFA